MKTIAIIPARGGSKRIPNKNIIDFYGMPLIYYTLKAASDSKLFDKIIISTDSDLVKKTCEVLNYEVPFLRNSNYDDFSSVSQATIAALRQAESYYNESYDYVVQLMPNCPLRTSNDISNQFEDFINSGMHFSISCAKFGWQNPWWAFEMKDYNLASWKFPEALTDRSQDLPALFSPTGATWVAKASELYRINSFYSQNTKFFELDVFNSVDIDTYEDLQFAKNMYKISNI